MQNRKKPRIVSALNNLENRKTDAVKMVNS